NSTNASALQVALSVALLLFTVLITGTIPALAVPPAPNARPQPKFQHVLLVSVDGLHAVDLERYIDLHANSTMAQLAQQGVVYPNASTSRPSDSFPGLLSMVTGGTPRSTGVFYDDSYDRTLSPPGSNCSTKGTEVVYDESIDFDSTKIDGGGGINPANLPLDGSKGCTPVYPHSFLRVNTIFEVAHEAGLHTAWSDKHPAYDLVNGPSGKGVADLYTPEIASTDGTRLGTEAYDDLKVNAVLNEISGKDHTGTKSAPVPAIFGMNFQAVSVTQKLTGDGYLDSVGTPSPELQAALDHTDQSLGKMLAALRANNLFSDTFIIITAKHGQSPIDPNKYQKVPSSTLKAGGVSSFVAQLTTDDIALFWLNDQSKTDAVVSALTANEATAHIQEIFSGDALELLFNDPT